MEPSIAYMCLFGKDDDFKEYKKSAEVTILTDYMKRSKLLTGYVAPTSGGITFEENKAELERLIIETQNALEQGLIEPKDALRIQADLRVKLNDKFNVQAKEEERTIVVERKFDFVCPTTHRECYQLNKEEAMKRWNLIEKQ